MIKHIVVTQEHIDKGKPTEYDSCPVFLAIHEVCPNIEGVYGDHFDWWTPDSDLVRTSAPEIVNEFVLDFDDLHSVNPFEFDLDIPDNVKCD